MQTNRALAEKHRIPAMGKHPRSRKRPRSNTTLETLPPSVWKRPRASSNRDILPIRDVPRPDNLAHVFSNKSLLVHIFLPILLAVAHDETRVQLRSTCKLFRSIYFSTRFRRITMDDLAMHLTKPGVPHIRDWEVVQGDLGSPSSNYPPNDADLPDKSNPSFDHPSKRSVLCPVYKPASSIERDRVILPAATLTVYLYARPPCIEESAWHESMFRRPQQTHAGCSLLKTARVPSPLFGSVHKEMWTARSNSRGFTVQDVADICTGRWLVEGQLGENDAGLVVPLRFDPDFEGYILDALQMARFEY